MMEDVMLAKYERGAQEAEKKTYPLLSSSMIVMYHPHQRRIQGKADDKKKVMGKERKSKERVFGSGDL
jgi:hypothetical protein